MENSSNETFAELFKDHLDRSEGHLMKIIERITIMEGKTDGINRRLDISNGRIAKSEDAIQDLRIGQASVIGEITSLKRFADNSQVEGNKLKNTFIEKALYVIAGLITAWIVKN